MVEENSRTIEGRVIDVEDNIGELGVMLDSMNQNITSLGDSLEDILALADIINGISDRVTALETGHVVFNVVLDDVEGSLSGELDALEGTLNLLNEDVVDLNDEWEEVIIDLADLETTYESAVRA